MKKMILAVIVIVTGISLKAQVSPSFEAKADAFMNEVESKLQHGTDTSQIDWESIYNLADIVIADQAFDAEWSIYVANEQSQRQIAVSCVGGAVSNYAYCLKKCSRREQWPPNPCPPNTCQNMFSYDLLNCVGLVSQKPSPGK